MLQACDIKTDISNSSGMRAFSGGGIDRRADRRYQVHYLPASQSILKDRKKAIDTLGVYIKFGRVMFSIRA